MVGIVVVSHSQKLAEGAVELAKLMAGDANIVAAGGLDDGQVGTSFEKIMSAVEEVHEEDGVAVLMDMLGDLPMTHIFQEDGLYLDGVVQGIRAFGDNPKAVSMEVFYRDAAKINGLSTK